MENLSRQLKESVSSASYSRDAVDNMFSREYKESGIDTLADTMQNVSNLLKDYSRGVEEGKYLFKVPDGHVVNAFKVLGQIENIITMRMHEE